MRFLKLPISIFLIVFLLFASITPCFAISDSSYIWSSDSYEPVSATANNTIGSNVTEDNSTENKSIASETTESSSTETPSTEADSTGAGANNELNLESGSAILIEQTTGQVLYSHNIHEQLRPASVTKVMSILLIMEALDSGKISLTDPVPCSENAASMGGSQIWLDPKETLTVDEMLKAICVNSANDCVVALSEYIAGTEEAFVQMMNDKAKDLGMNDTTFKNCHGLDEDGHVTSSYDIALMSRELLEKHPTVTNYTTIWMDTLRDRKITTF